MHVVEGVNDQRRKKEIKARQRKKPSSASLHRCIHFIALHARGYPSDVDFFLRRVPARPLFNTSFLLRCARVPFRTRTCCRTLPSGPNYCTVRRRPSIFLFVVSIAPSYVSLLSFLMSFLPAVLPISWTTWWPILGALARARKERGMPEQAHEGP
jgi:hypothetical protein